MRTPSYERKRKHKFLTWAAVLVTLFALDSGISWLTYGAPEFVYMPVRQGEQQDTLTVHGAGMRADADKQSKPLQVVWKENNQDALIVKFDPNLTARDQIVKTTYNEILRREYKKITLNLTSMSGRFGTDLINYIQREGNLIEVTGVILRDATMTADDVLKAPKAWESLYHQGWFGSFIPPSFILNFLMNGLISSDFEEPHLSDIEPMSASELTSLREHWHASKYWPFSGVTSQSRQIFWRRPIPAGMYRGIPLVIIRSSADNMVSADNRSWLAAFGAGNDRLIEVSSPHGTVFHASIREFPTAWRNAERQAYTILYPVG